jgi:uncharacterized membrane protein YebE (DUF533 family)
LPVVDAVAAVQAAGAALTDAAHVIADPLRFKRKLKIGTRAFALLRARDNLLSLWDSAGAASAGAGMAKSAWVATIFFAPAAPSGALAWLGLGGMAAAVTPLGWVVATALASGGAYYGVMKWIGSGTDHFVDTIPKFITTPIDLLGAQLFDLIGALALQVAAIDGHIDPRERATIIEHFVSEWGFDPIYADRAIALIAANIDEARVVDLARSLAAFQHDNPDCNAAAMLDELMDLLRDVMKADGKIDQREEHAIAAIERVFEEARRVTLAGIASNLSSGIATARTAAGEAIGSAAVAMRSTKQSLAARLTSPRNASHGS